ncbi:MAG: molybdopterin-dependent oxidoreductase, partial [Pseudomonas sp.]
TAARIALALRQTAKGKATEIAGAAGIQSWHQAAVENIAQGARHPVFIASVTATRLDDIAAEAVQAAPDDLARLGFAVAHAIDSGAPAVSGLEAEAQELAQRIAEALLAAERPLLVSGASLGNPAIIEAAASIAQALKNREKNGSISMVVPEANSMGMALLLADEQADKSVEAALTALIAGEYDALVVLENDLYRRADSQLVDAALNAAKVVVVIDHQQSATADKAHILLPASSFAEGDGTLVSQEGRAQRFFQVFEPSYYNPDVLIREGWRWLHALRNTFLGQPVDWTTLDQVTEACAAVHPRLAPITEAAPDASFRIKGQKLARAPHRYSGRTAMRANLSVHEPRQPQDPDSPFAFSMEGYAGNKEDRQQIPFAWAPGWNSPQAWNKFQDEVGGHLRSGDPGVRLLDGPRMDLDWAQAPAAFAPAAGTWQVVPLHHLFGSDENTSRAEPLQQRMPQPYVALAEAEAQRLGVTDGTLLSITLSDQQLQLPLRIISELPLGVAGLPAGLPGIPPLSSGSIVTGLKGVAQ